MKPRQGKRKVTSKKVSEKPVQKQECLLFLLPPEIHMHIISFLKNHCRAYIRTCSYIRQVFFQNRTAFEKKFPFLFLYKEQQDILNCLFKHRLDEEPLYIKCDMGTGKTAAIIMSAFEVFKGENVLIAIPPKTFTTWIPEIKRFCNSSKGLFKFDLDPFVSDVLVIHNMNKKHHDFYRQSDMIKTFENNQFKIVLTTPYFLKSVRNFEGVLFIDEAHLTCSGYWDQVGARLIIGLSAQFPEKSRWSNVIEIEVDSTERKPCLSYDYIQLARRLNIWDLNSKNHLSYIANTVETQILKNKIKKVIVLLNCKAQLLQVSTLKDHFTEKIIKKGYSIFTFRNANYSSYDAFRKIEKGIMFASYYSCSEGVNFNMVSDAILFDFDVLSLGKAKQVVGRFARRNNAADVVKFHLILDKSVEDGILSKLCMVHATNPNISIVEKKPSKTITEIIARLRNYGMMEPLDLCEEEFSLLFGKVSADFCLEDCEKFKIAFCYLLPLINL